jgi:hypothetical protein
MNTCVFHRKPNHRAAITVCSVRRATIALLATSLAIAFPTSTQAESQLKSLNVYPAEIQLTTQRDSQRFIVVATREDGVTLDVTETAQAVLDNPAVATLEKQTLHPKADGTANLQIQHEGLTATATVNVQQATQDRPISFQLDVMPVFMRAGCNTGSCHGAARGKDGFRLSLFGFDPKGDYQRITREIGVRRINLAIPEHSLLVEKSVGAVPHTGVKRFDPSSTYSETLLRWLNAGAPSDATEPPELVDLELYPPRAVIEGKGATQSFLARARFADGTDRDVTNLVTFASNNDNSGPITEDGLVTAAERGEAFVMARYDTKTVVAQVLVLPKDLNYTPPQITGNYIDHLVGAKLERLRILPSELCNDEEFLRRVTLDITGTIPTEEEYQTFLADSSPDKRAKRIDQLLGRKEFSEIWAM